MELGLSVSSLTLALIVDPIGDVDVHRPSFNHGKGLTQAHSMIGRVPLTIVQDCLRSAGSGAFNFRCDGDREARFRHSLVN